jgi:MerR family regulatory protein
VRHPIRIGQAQECGLRIDTIRFYENRDCLKRSSRTQGGFRLFGGQRDRDPPTLDKNSALLDWPHQELGRDLIRVALTH